MLQKMFPKKGEKIRKSDLMDLRTIGNSVSWGRYVRVTRKNKNNESDLPLTIASQYGLIDQRDFF